MVSGLVERYGRTGFAAITSLIWFLPMASWAGSSDLSPVDRTAVPTVSAAIGGVGFVVWLILLTQLRRYPVTERTRRYALTQMSSNEKTWNLILFIFVAGAIAWLNAAATVDWGPLASALGSGRPGPLAFAGALTLFLIVMIAGIVFSWRKASTAFRERSAQQAR